MVRRLRREPHSFLNGYQVDVGSGMHRLHLEDTPVEANGFGMRDRIFFQLDAAGKELSGAFPGADGADVFRSPLRTALSPVDGARSRRRSCGLDSAAPRPGGR